MLFRIIVSLLIIVPFASSSEAVTAKKKSSGSQQMKKQKSSKLPQSTGTPEKSPDQAKAIEDAYEMAYGYYQINPEALDRLKEHFDDDVADAIKQHFSKDSEVVDLERQPKQFQTLLNSNASEPRIFPATDFSQKLKDFLEKRHTGLLTYKGRVLTKKDVVGIFRFLFAYNKLWVEKDTAIEVPDQLKGASFSKQMKFIKESLPSMTNKTDYVPYSEIETKLIPAQNHYSKSIENWREDFSAKIADLITAVGNTNNQVLETQLKLVLWGMEYDYLQKLGEDLQSLKGLKSKEQGELKRLNDEALGWVKKDRIQYAIYLRVLYDNQTDAITALKIAENIAARTALSEFKKVLSSNMPKGDLIDNGNVDKIVFGEVKVSGKHFSEDYVFEKVKRHVVNTYFKIEAQKSEKDIIEIDEAADIWLLNHGNVKYEDPILLNAHNVFTYAISPQFMTEVQGWAHAVTFEKDPKIIDARKELRRVNSAYARANQQINRYQSKIDELTMRIERGVEGEKGQREKASDVRASFDSSCKSLQGKIDDEAEIIKGIGGHHPQVDYVFYKEDKIKDTEKPDELNLAISNHITDKAMKEIGQNINADIEDATHRSFRENKYPDYQLEQAKNPKTGEGNLSLKRFAGVILKSHRPGDEKNNFGLGLAFEVFVKAPIKIDLKTTAYLDYCKPGEKKSDKDLIKYARKEIAGIKKK